MFPVILLAAGLSAGLVRSAPTPSFEIAVVVSAGGQEADVTLAEKSAVAIRFVAKMPPDDRSVWPVAGPVRPALVHLPTSAARVPRGGRAARLAIPPGRTHDPSHR